MTRLPATLPAALPATLPAALLLFVLLVVAGCGSDAGDDSGASDAPSAEPTSESSHDATATTDEATEPSDDTSSDVAGASAGAVVEAAADPGELSDDDVQAIADTIVTVDLTGNCDLLTDRFLESQVFVADDHEKACDLYEKVFVEKQYGVEDLIISDIKGTQQKATAKFGSTIVDLTLTYTLVNDGGTWKLDAFDF